MDLERASEIVHACTAHVFHAMGITEEAPPSLKEYSLRELLEANDIVRAENDRPGEGPRTIQVVCDDRLVAALYAATHYQPANPKDADPICVVGDCGLYALSMKAVDEDKRQMIRHQFSTN